MCTWTKTVLDKFETIFWATFTLSKLISKRDFTSVAIFIIRGVPQQQQKYDTY